MSLKTFTRSFAGGELSAQLFGRLDLAKFQTGLAKCLNFIVTPQGPAENRPGFQYVLKTKTQAVLVPFTYNSEQSFALEFGIGYIRFHTQGSTLLETAIAITGATAADPGVFTATAHGLNNGDWVQLADIGGFPLLTGRWGIVTAATANTFSLTDLFVKDISTVGMGPYTTGGTVSRVYEISTNYVLNDLYDLHYAQSADVLTLVHHRIVPRELRRLAATNWTLTRPSFSPTTATPVKPSATKGGSGGTPERHSYVATALANDTLEESFASPSVASRAVDLSVAGNYVDVQVVTQAGVVRYNIYKLKSGIYGYIGQTNGAKFRDSNIVPDMSKTPPLSANPFTLGAISTVTVTAGGSGYNTNPDTGGAITAVTITISGTGYTAAPTVTISGSGSGATATAALLGDTVASVTITAAGSLYDNPTVSFSGGSGSGATATATASAIAQGATVQLAVADATGTGAEVEAVVSGGAITSVRIVSPGQDYTAPTMTIVNTGGGTGAAFTFTLTDSTVNPQAVGYFEQRRVFGGSLAAQQTIWMTRSGTERNMTYSIPTQDDDAITARIVAREASVVRHMVPLNDLLAFTSGGIWRVASPTGEPLTPANLSAKPQSYVGASMAQPVSTSASVLYVPARGSHIRELAYNWEAQVYRADDVAVLAAHLFDYKSVLQLTYSQTPHQVLWAVRDDGVLLGMTYQPEHQIKAWHQHATTGGSFKSVCAIPEGDEDGLYAIVERRINGLTVRYIERMHSRNFASISDAFFVDSGATYNGAPTTTITGLHHLEGARVVALADGGVEPSQRVIGGAITLQAAASVVHIGLAYSCDAQSMPFSHERAAAFGQGVTKNVSKVSLRLYQSSGLAIGPSFDDLTPMPQRTSADEYGNPPALITGMYEFRPSPKWQQDGAVCVRQANPLPATLLSMTVECAVGG